MIHKALIVYRIDKNIRANAGLVNKINGQVRSLNGLGIRTDYIIHGNQTIYKNSEVMWKARQGSNSFKWNFFNFLHFILQQQYDLYIIRYGLTTWPFLHWLKLLRSKNPESVILIDMPTYPYRLEWKGIRGKIIYGIDFSLRGKLKKYVDGILHSGLEHEIFGIPTIGFSNGIQVSSLLARNPDKTSEMRMLAIGKWQYWHGLDRLLRGIFQYLKSGKTDIRLTIIGEGPEMAKIVQIIKNLQIEQFVHLVGSEAGLALNEYFDKADIGVGTLGLHRKRVKIDASLKHREYTARGLPFIMSACDADNLHLQEFVLKFPEDESSIDLNKVMEFYKNLKMDMIIPKMRSFAERHLDWNAKMKRLINQIEEL